MHIQLSEEIDLKDYTGYQELPSYRTLGGGEMTHHHI